MSIVSQGSAVRTVKMTVMDESCGDRLDIYSGLVHTWCTDKGYLRRWDSPDSVRYVVVVVPASNSLCEQSTHRVHIRNCYIHPCMPHQPPGHRQLCVRARIECSDTFTPLAFEVVFERRGVSTVQYELVADTCILMPGLANVQLLYK